MNKLRLHSGIVLLLLVAFVIHSTIALIPPLNGDEATFWEWSRHLATGYYAHPPMTAWLVALITNLLGIFKYNVRLAAILLHLGTILFCYLIANDVFNNKTKALMAACSYAIMPLSIVLGTLMTTDANLVFCFAAAAFFTRRAVIEEKRYNWYWAGIACGGMLLTKFMAVLFFPGIFLFLLFNKNYRGVFLTKEPYLASLISLVIFSPFLYWNYKNSWLTFQFNFYMRHREEGFDIEKPLKYIAGQMAAASPVFLILILTALVYFFVISYKKSHNIPKDKSTRDSILLLVYYAAFPLIYFGGTSLGVEVAPHWPAIIYPVAAVVMIAWLDRVIFQKTGKSAWLSKTFWIGSVVSGLISLTLIVLALFPKILPDHLIYTEKVYGEAPVISHYFGWEEIGNHIDQVKKEWEEKPEGLFFTSKDYSLASMLGFYTPSHPQFYLMNVTKNIVHGKSYLLWEKGKKTIGANTIYVSDTPDSFKSRLPDFFKEVKHLKPFVIRDIDGRILRSFYIAIGLHYLGGEPDNLSLW